jgi:hypothetical protein
MLWFARGGGVGQGRREIEKLLTDVFKVTTDLDKYMLDANVWYIVLAACKMPVQVRRREIGNVPICRLQPPHAACNCGVLASPLASATPAQRKR